MAIDLSGWEKVITQIAQDLHDGKIKPTDLNQESITKTFKTLNEGSADGYGKGWTAPKPNELPSRDAILMQQNLYRFSGAKTFTMLEELNSKMVKDGKIVPFEQFKSEALKLNDQYNLNHLQAEYQTAKHSAKMADVWKEAVRNKAQFPNLKFKTQQDDKVSDEHRKLNDIIVAIDADFWKTHYPPLRFRCRCYVIQTAAAVSETIPKVDVPAEFQNNVGQTKEIFSETKHPYFQLTKRSAQGRVDLKTALENSKEAAPQYTVRTPKERSVKVSMFADLKDIQSNLKTAVTAADTLGVKAQVNAHKSGMKNPELKFDDVTGDKVQPSSGNLKNAITNAFNKKLQKGGQLRGLNETFIAFDLDNYKKPQLEHSLADVAKQVNSKIKHYKNITSCYFEYKGKMIRVNKGDSFEQIQDKLNELL